ncbi:hypothetical protein KEJ45_04880 [Candidatus Bathyarchaeota archaeon]|nr:hypothetical protein [Candidatus Bathyarchaeota archaeon]
MKVLIKRGKKSWLLYWKPLRGKRFYPINYANLAFVGALEEIRRKINQLLAGKASSVEFEAHYCKATKVLALWA